MPRVDSDPCYPRFSPRFFRWFPPGCPQERCVDRPAERLDSLGSKGLQETKTPSRPLSFRVKICGERSLDPSVSRVSPRRPTVCPQVDRGSTHTLWKAWIQDASTGGVTWGEGLPPGKYLPRCLDPSLWGDGQAIACPRVVHSLLLSCDQSGPGRPPQGAVPRLGKTL